MIYPINSTTLEFNVNRQAHDGTETLRRVSATIISTSQRADHVDRTPRRVAKGKFHLNGRPKNTDKKGLTKT